MSESGAAEARRGRLRAPPTFASLRHADFRLLWITTVLSAAANWLQQVTLGWLAFDLTDSALVAGVVFGIRSLPMLLVGPLGGVLGDRFARKAGLMINSGRMAVVALAFAMLLVAGSVEVWHILLFTTVQGLGQALVNPVRYAMVANTVPQADLMNAIALNSFAFSTMRVVGPAAAGVLIAVSGPELNFAIQGAFFALTFLLVLPIHTPYSTLSLNRSHASMASSLAGGVKYVVNQPTILGLTLLGLGPAFFTTPINLGLLPVFARESLDVGSQGLGVLYSMQGVGAVLATLAIASLGGYRNIGWLVAVAAIGNALAVCFYSQLTIFVLALPFLAMATLCFTAYSTVSQTIIQTITPDEYRGRVMGLHMMDHGLTPLGSLVFGVIAEYYDVSGAMLLAGLSGLAFVLIVLARYPMVRAYRTGRPAATLMPEPPARGARDEIATIEPAAD